MFTVVNNSTIQSNERALLSIGFDSLSELLPERWSLEPGLLEPAATLPVSKQIRRPDAIWTLRAPDATSLPVVVEAKSRVEPRDVEFIVSQLSALRDVGEPLLVAPFLSERTQSLLRERRISFIDSYGNLFVAFDRPANLLRAQGATKSRQPDLRPRRSLRGPITGRIVRFVCDFRPPFGVREIATRTNVSAGGVSRILDFLDRERYITRDEGGSVASVDWQSLLQRWAGDLARDRIESLFFVPRGLDDLKRRLLSASIDYAVTGAWAASFFALVAPPGEAYIYVSDIAGAAKALELKSSERATNVRLIEAFDRVALERCEVRSDLNVAAPTQILADLWTAQLRSNDEISGFQQWMQVNEDVWRRN